MGSPTRISNYVPVGVAQLIGMYSKPRGTLVPLLPVILAITPNTGPAAGGTLVRITGYNFDNVSGVTIGGAPCTSVIVGGGIITCYSPAGSAGARDVVVTGPAGSTTLAGGFTYASAASVPTFASVANVLASGAASTVGDIDGGYTVTVTGTNFVIGSTTVTFGGTSATGVSVSSSTTLTCTVPAHAAGLVDVVVTTSGGSATGVGAWEYFSIAQTNASGYWRGYGGTLPWAATATAGAAGTTGAITTGGVSDPTAGTALNGKGVAHFDGVANYAINNTTASGNVWNTTGGATIALVKFNSESAPTGNNYDDPPIIEDSNYDCGLTVSTSGAAGFGYDGAYEITPAAAVSTGQFHFVMHRWNGATEGVTVDTATEVTHALGTITIMNGTLFIGRWAGGAKYAAMELVELATFPATISNTTRDKIRAYFATRYNLSTI